MKKNLTQLSRNLLMMVFLLGAIMSQAQVTDEHKSEMIKQLADLKSKIAQFEASLNSTDVTVDDLINLTEEFQDPISNIDGHLYEIKSTTTLEEEVEIVEEIVEDLFGDGDSDEDMEEDEDGGGKSYKGDFMPKKLKNKFKSFSDDSFVLGWGVNGMADENAAFQYEPWGSSNWEVGFVLKKQLGKTKSRLVYGLTLNTHYFKLDNQDIFATNESISEDQGYQVVDDNSYDKVRFGVRYLQIPLGVGVKIGRKAEVYVGGHAGLRVKGYTKKEFKTEAGEQIELVGRDNYGLNNFNYGVDLALGGLKYKVFGKYDFNPTFAKGTTNNNIFTVGIRYGY